MTLKMSHTRYGVLVPEQILSPWESESGLFALCPPSGLGASLCRAAKEPAQRDTKRFPLSYALWGLQAVQGELEYCIFSV